MTSAASEPLTADSKRDLRVPIVIAVTGHRHLHADCLAKLERAVEELLRQLRQLYPHSPLRLLSGLAEGADRLAARVALANQAELVAVLPLELEDYQSDFHSQESLAEFQELLRSASGQIVVKAHPDASPDRSLSYARQGAYLVEHCDLLLALWDGEPSGKSGGTPDVVRYRLQGLPPSLQRTNRYLDRHTGDVYQIVTPRAEARNLTDAGRALILQPATIPSSTSSVLRPDPRLTAIDRLNSDLLSSQQQSDVPTVVAGDSSQDPLPGWRVRFERTDALAIHFQRRTWRAFIAILATSVCSLLSLQLHDSLFQSTEELLAAYLIFLVAAYGIYLWTKQCRLESRAFDYRALAEGLRVQIAWREAGLKQLVIDCYLSRQHDVLSWIRRALMNWDSHRDLARLDESITNQSLGQAMENWVSEQRRFFEKAIHRQRKRHRRFTIAANGLIWMGLFLSALKLWTGASHWVFSLGIIPPILAASLAAVVKMSAWSEQIRLYDAMRQLFETAEARLPLLISRGDLEAAKQLLIELGKEALAENADWLALHRQRPINSPNLSS